MKFKNILNEQVQPTTKQELIKIIRETIKKEGNNCDLNFIDTSNIEDMSFMFYDLRGIRTINEDDQK